MNARIGTALMFAATGFAAMLSFILTTVAMDKLPDAAILGVCTVIAFAIVAATGGWRVVRRLKQIDTQALALAAGGGALAFWAAPLLALTQRATSAPSGADTLFFTTACWCVLVVAGAYLVRSERPALTGIAGAVCSAAGAMGLLASWEYPSSFAPFAKFPERESLMMVAGVLFAAGVLGIGRALRRLEPRDVGTIALAGAAALGAVASVPSLPVLLSPAQGVLQAPVYLGVVGAAFAVCWIRLSAQVGSARTSASLLLVPVAMTALSAYEAATVVFGQRPFEMRGVLTGSAIVIVGAGVLWLAVPSQARARMTHAGAGRVALWIAVAACVVALISLGTPALDALSEAHVDETFRATWTMLGFESAAGWMPVAGALLALTAVLEARRGAAARTWVSAAAAVLVCAIAMPQLADTTLHTWNQWIPAIVQQSYGTEYARLSVTAIVDPTRVAAMALAVLAVAVLGLASVRGTDSSAAQKEGSS